MHRRRVGPAPPPADAAPATAAPKLTRAPELLTFVEAVYPPAALAEKRTAAVALAMNIELDGSVSNVEVTTPAGHGFDEAAVAAAQQFKWRPAELDGKPAVVRIAYRYVFTLKAEEPEPAPTPVGVLIGELLERGTRAPLVGISVRIEGQDEPYFTDAKGRFEVKDLPAGPVVIHVEDEAFANLEDEEQIVAGQATEVRYYLEAKFGPVLLIPGVRADYFGASDKLYVQPRLTARWTVRPGTVIKGGVGLFAQAPRTEQLIDGLGTPGLDVETSLQGSLGFEQTLAEGLTLDVVGFYKSFDGLVTRSDTGADLYANQGTGQAYGMELLLRKNLTSRLYGWVAYTLSRSERRDAPGEALRVFDVDQTHNLTLVAQYKFTPTWELGVRWRYVTGNPSTPVTGADFNADTGEYVPRFGAVNSGRLDAFHQLDIRLDKHWIFDTWKLTTYLEVQNAYNRANPEEIEYQYDYARSGVQAGLPIVPSIGARGSF